MKHSSPPAFLVLVTAFLFCTKPIAARNFYPAALIPGVNVGYIFGAGISLGTEINYTPFAFNSGAGRTATGLYASMNYFYSKGEIYRETWYHTFSYGALALSDSRFMFKAGVNRTILRWGREKINKKISRKRSLDLDLSYAPKANGAFVGYRLYFPGDACFGLDISVVNMVYAAYRYNFAPGMFDGKKE